MKFGHRRIFFPLEVVRALLRYDRWNVWGHYNCQRRKGLKMLQPSQVSQTETSKTRSQSFCLSVFLVPASLSWQHLWASITHPCYVYGDSIFTLNQNSSCVQLWLSFFRSSPLSRRCSSPVVLWRPTQFCTVLQLPACRDCSEGHRAWKIHNTNNNRWINVVSRKNISQTRNQDISVRACRTLSW